MNRAGLFRRMIEQRIQLAVFISGLFLIGCFYGLRGFATLTYSAVVTEGNPAVEQDFSKFRHNSAQHTRMPCLVCHVRNDNRTRITYPGHIPCASCHQQQFADNTNPICTICHTTTSVKAFPGLRSFRTAFDHAKHARQTNCSTCHAPSSRGAALSVPSGSRGHATCFQCHGPQAKAGGREISSCSVCHKAGRPSRFSESSPAYSVNFNHSEHSARRISCAACHQARAGKMSAPIVSMHFAPPGAASCGACHNNKRAFGGRDFNDCKRCHQGPTFKF